MKGVDELQRTFSPLFRAIHQFGKAFRALSQEFPVKSGELAILVCLGFHHKDGGMNPSQISEITGHSRSSVAQMLNTMEEAGYIERTISQEDRRKMLLGLTHEGLELLAKIQHRLDEAVRVLEERMGEKDSEQLIVLLNKAAGVFFEISDKTDRQVH